MTPPIPDGGQAVTKPDLDDPVPEEAPAAEIPVGLGQRVMVVGDLLLPTEPSPSSRALATDVALTLDHWQGPGTVIVCGNLFAAVRQPGRRAGPRHPGGPPRPGRGHPGLHRPRGLPSDRAARLAGPGRGLRPRRRHRALPGGRRGRRLGRPPADHRRPASAGCSSVPAAPRTAPRGSPGGDGDRPWLGGIDRLEDPAASGRFVSSRTLYRRLGRFVWVPPLLAVVVALVVRLTVVYHGVYHLVSRRRDPAGCWCGPTPPPGPAGWPSPWPWWWSWS